MSPLRPGEANRPFETIRDRRRDQVVVGIYDSSRMSSTVPPSTSTATSSAPLPAPGPTRSQAQVYLNPPSDYEVPPTAQLILFEDTEISMGPLQRWITNGWRWLWSRPVALRGLFLDAVPVQESFAVAVAAPAPASTTSTTLTLTPKLIPATTTTTVSVDADIPRPGLRSGSTSSTSPVTLSDHKTSHPKTIMILGAMNRRRGLYIFCSISTPADTE